MLITVRPTDEIFTTVTVSEANEPKDDLPLLTWAIFHHIDKYYPEALEPSKIKQLQDKEKEESSLETSSSEQEKCKTDYEKLDYKLPLLNFRMVKSLNYDSEKEDFINSEDRLKKIKQRFRELSQDDFN